MHTSALPLTAAAPPGVFTGDIALALLALMIILSAKSSRQQTVQMVGPLHLDTPGMGILEAGTTIWDRSSAGGSGWMQFFVTG